jgi:nicotinate-nucleotide adenylyltransferase
VTIGLLGGSFDPIHVGHLALAQAALDRLGLAEVRFIPAGHPWQKGEITDAAHRAKMVAAAIAGEPRFSLDMHEIERPGPTYTVDTLRALRTALGAEIPLVLLIGADQMERLDTWHDWQRLLEFSHLAVARRNDAVMTLSWPLQEFYNEHWGAPAQLSNRPAGCIVDLEMPPVDASATEIRDLLRRPPSPARDARLAQIVPAPVLDYIRAHCLYR